jgi:hypothetical protein
LRCLDIHQEPETKEEKSMPIDLNDAEPQRDRSLIPAAVYCLKITVKPGGSGEGRFLRVAKNLRSLMLELKYSVVGGDYAGKQIQDFITVDFDETDDLHLSPIEPDKLENYRTSVRMGRSKLRAIIDSAYGLQPNDDSEAARAKRKLASYGALNGLEFYAQVDEKPGSDGYGPRNYVDFVITPDLPDWPKQPAKAVAPFKRTLADDLDDEIAI